MALLTFLGHKSGLIPACSLRNYASSPKKNFVWIVCHSIWGFPKNSGYHFGGPHNKDLNLGKLPYRNGVKGVYSLLTQENMKAHEGYEKRDHAVDPNNPA